MLKMRNPFADIKATEMSIEQIQELFVTPKFIEKIYTPNAMFITGQRGSGKTTVMRYIEYNPCIEEDGFEYIGIYYRFDRMIYGQCLLSNDDIELFLHHLIIALIKRLVNQLTDLCEKYQKCFTHFEQFSKTICATFFDDETECHSLSELMQFLEKQRFLTMKYIRNPHRVERPLTCDFSGGLTSIVNQLHKESWLSHVTWMFLLDEYENLEQSQRRAVNALIKSASYGYTFKVFHRPIFLDTQVLESHEHLMVQHDIITTDFYEEIIGGDLYYPEFMARLVSKRLQNYCIVNGFQYSNEDLDIKQHLTELSVEEEFGRFLERRNSIEGIKAEIKKILRNEENDAAVELVNQLADSCAIFELRLFLAILEKKTKSIHNEQERVESVRAITKAFCTQSKSYKNWVANYRYTVLYLLCFETRCQRQITGWKQILSLSNGIARHVINILYYMFESENMGHSGESTTDSPFRCFSAEEQTKAVHIVGKKLYEDIIKVPVVGRAEVSMIEYLGRIFRLCHKDPTMRKWEVNHFVICKQDQLPVDSTQQEKVDQVLEAAITWGHLEKVKSTKEKNNSELPADASAYRLHPLLAVYFGISWRKKQRYNMTYAELYAAAYDKQCARRNFSNASGNILGDHAKGELEATLETQLTINNLEKTNQWEE